MKKITLMMIASASILLATPAMDTTPMKDKCMTQMKQGKMCCKKNSKKNKMFQRKLDSPFLIKKGLPHMSKMIMPYMNNPAFNLTEEQKKKLVKVRKSTMSAIREAKVEVKALRKEIIIASQSGVSLDIIKGKVAKLALIESAATLTHLKCIEATKDILTKDQMYFLFINKNKRMNHGKKSMKQNKCKR